LIKTRLGGFFVRVTIAAGRLRRLRFPPAYYLQRLGLGLAAYIGVRLKTRTYLWAIRLAKNATAVLLIEVDTGHARGLATGHAGDRRGN
jgi:hypothetical protein